MPIQVFHDRGATVVDLDQTRFGSLSTTVETLGTFFFGPGEPARVVVSTLGAAPGAVVADAVLFVPGPPAAASHATRVAARELRMRLAEEVARLDRQIEELESAGPRRPVAMAVADLPETKHIPLAIRGVVHNPGPVVPRGMLQVVASSQRLSPSPFRSR